MEYREQTSGYHWEEGRGQRQDKGRRLRYKLLGIKISHKDVLYNMGNS